MKNERIYGISVVDSNNTDYPKLCSSENASNLSEKYIDGPFCGTHEVKNGKWYHRYAKGRSILRHKELGCYKIINLSVPVGSKFKNLSYNWPKTYLFCAQYYFLSCLNI